MSSTESVAFTGRVSGTLTARPRLCYSGWSTSQRPLRETAVGAERCSITPRMFVVEVGPCDATCSTTSLAEGGATDRVQLALLVDRCFHGVANELHRLTAMSTLCSRRHSADPSLRHR